jgi:hypothetical protein
VNTFSCSEALVPSVSGCWLAPIAISKDWPAVQFCPCHVHAGSAEAFAEGVGEEAAYLATDIVLAGEFIISASGQEDVIGTRHGDRIAAAASVPREDPSHRQHRRCIGEYALLGGWLDKANGDGTNRHTLAEHRQERIHHQSRGRSVARVIEPALQAAKTARSSTRPTKDLTAYDLYLRAYAIVFSSAGKIPDALCLTEQAIERDPH